MGEREGGLPRGCHSVVRPPGDSCGPPYPPVDYENRLTLSTHFPDPPISPADWVSQAEAARLRGVSRQAIAKLVRHGRLTSVVIGGHTLVSRAEVLAFQ